jgi:hypothetical protein
MKLCDSGNPVEVYSGRNVDAMPRLLADGRIPMSASQLMHYRINESDKFSDWKNYFDTSDLIAYSSKGDGKVKFILTVDKSGKITENGRRALELINPDLKRRSGAIELVGDQYQTLDGIEVATGNLGRTGSWLTQGEILGNKAWRILARHPDEVPAEFAEDSNLLKEYSNWVANQTGDNKNMAVYVDSLGKSPKLRAWYVYGLEFRSDAYGGNDLGIGYGRLLGIAPEALDTKIVRPTLEQTLTVGSILEETGHTSAFAPDQIKKLQNILEQKGYQIQRRK